MARKDPAGRLFDFFERGQPTKVDANRPAREVLASVVNVKPPTDFALLHRRFAKIVDLPRIIEAQLRALPGLNEHLHLRWKAQVVPAFQEFNLQATWATFIGRIDATTLQNLEWCSERLSEAAGEPEIDDTELARLREEIAEIVEEAGNTNISEAVRRFVADNLAQVLEAIDDYPIAGVEPIREAVQTVVGGFVFEYGKGERPKSTPLGAKLYRAIMLLAALCGMGSFGLQIEERMHGQHPEVGVEVEHEGPSTLLISAPQSDSECVDPGARAG